MMNQFKNLLAVSAILVVIFSLFLRLFNFGVTPDLHVDEMSFGYSAYAWLMTGADEYGRAPGLVLESLGDWKLALYAYFVFPLVALFGLNEWSVRLPSMLFGLMTVPLMYFLTNRLLGDKRVAMVAALCLAILPWHVVFSRTANEVTMELFFLMLGVWMYLRWVQELSVRYLVISFLALALALISYYPAFVTVPLIAAYLPALRIDQMNVRRLRWWKGLVAAALPLIISAGLLVIFLLTQPKDRIATTSFLGHDAIPAEVFARVTASGLSDSPIWWTRVFNNKYVVSINYFLDNYFAHFDPRFWFVVGEPTHSRYDIPYQGPLYLWMAPFLLVGLAVTGHKVLDEKDRSALLVILWILAAMIPGAMTYEAVNLQRSFLAIPALVWLVALGMVRVWGLLLGFKLIWRNLGVGLGGVAVIALIATFYDNYFVHGPRYTPWFRHGYVEELLTKIRVHREGFSQVYVGDMPYLPMFYFDRIDPVVAQNLIKEHTSMHKSFRTLEEYDGMTLMPTDCPESGELNALYVCRGYVVPKNAYVLDVVRFGDNVPAYVLIRFLPEGDERLLEDKGFRIVVR